VVARTGDEIRPGPLRVRAISKKNLFLHMSDARHSVEGVTQLRVRATCLICKIVVAAEMCFEYSMQRIWQRKLLEERSTMTGRKQGVPPSSFCTPIENGSHCNRQARLHAEFT
jgi:hypothetical protein